MKKIYLVLGAIAVCAVLPVGFIFSGLVNVAASNPENALVEWVLSTTMKRSVSARARNLDAPGLADEHQIREGLSQYAGMCVDCHGAPGVKQSGFTRGLNPPPPILSEEVHEWDAAELFWITKHGVKMTGMPAFGQAHTDEEIWAMVAFLQQMPTMSPEEYASELQEAGPHVHGSESEVHETEDDGSVVHDDHDDSPADAHGNPEHGDSDSHATHEEAITQDDNHDNHDHSQEEPRSEDNTHDH